MKQAIEGLEPHLLWEHFYQLSQIPRCSKHEEKARDYVIDVAKRNHLEYKTDSVGNVVVKLPATPGRENAPVVVLQSHLDMVCEKNKDVAHDFSKDPIELVRDGEWITANGTTLGADNGIGVAAMLAVMESKEVEHGPLELLFTIDEETGLTGASGLDEHMLEGRTLLNLDSEEDGVIYIGCAGGRDTEIFLKKNTEAIRDGFVPVKILVTGLQGGHSGLNIHEGRGNAIKLLNRLLWNLRKEVDFQLGEMDGGNKHNAIPRECDAIIFVASNQVKTVQEFAGRYAEIYKEEYKFVEKDVRIEVSTDGFTAPSAALTTSLRDKLLDMLYAMPHGVMAMSLAVPGLVETSTNLAVLKTQDDKISVLTSQRSSVTSRLDEICEMVYAVGTLVDAEIRQGNGYPAWQPNPDSRVLQTAKAVHKELFGTEPEVKAIHAGLETGIIGAKFPGMDMISFGPTILGAHSPDERVHIPAVEKFWKFLTAMLATLAK